MRIKLSQYHLFFTQLLLFTGCFVTHYSFATDDLTSLPQTPEQTQKQLKPKGNVPNAIGYIPRLIDQSPTLLPPNSESARVPTTETTENQNWMDRGQKHIRNWADRSAHSMDDWFGDTNPDQPANATLRLILDNSWDKHDHYEIKPRIRGKVKLPTLEQRFSVVFGDDSLDNELNSNNAITNENPSNAPDKTYDRKQARDSNGSFALRWSEMSKDIPFDTDVDVGVRSRDDLYLRLELSRDWSLENDFSFYAEQIYRYGIDSEHYLRTNLEFRHARPQEAFISDQFSLTYADEQDDDLLWDNFIFRQHQFFKHHKFSYGIYTGGFLNDGDLRLNSWGPYISWRQPFLREWFFIQGDVNYLNDHREHRSHFPGLLVRMEALF